MSEVINWDAYPLNLLSRAHVENIVKTSSYVITDINARDLLSFMRFDLYAKLLYIDHKVKGLDIKYALNVYKRHLDVITGYSFQEYGQPNKNSFEKYVECFDRLIDIFKEDKYDPSLSLIPINANNVLIDGSHRTACAIYFNRTVRVVKFIDYVHIDYSSKWFAQNHLLETIINSISMEFCNWHSNIYMACIWPDAYSMKVQREQALQLLGQSFSIVSSSCVDLGQNGLRNFLIQVYGFMPWTGTAENHFKGIYGKLNEISSPKKSEIQFVLFQAHSLEEVLKVKKRIRDLFNLNKGAIHITDNAEETRQIAQLIYNENSLHHLKYASPDKFTYSYKLCVDFKSNLAEKGLNISNYVIDSSMVMAVYGIREAGDLDYLTIDEENIKQSLHSMELCSMECNDKSKIYHDIPVRDMVLNPHNHFVFNELKFLTLEQLRKFKQCRHEKKDLLDVRLIDSFVSTNRRHLFQWLLLQNYYRRKKIYFKNRIHSKVRSILLKAHVWELLKRILKKGSTAE